MTDVTAGQPDADQVFATLYETHLLRVRRTIAAGLRDGHQHLVEDLVQETFLAYWLYAQTTEVRSPGGLLHRIARHQLVNHYRSPEATVEQPRDFTDTVQARRLPAAPAAEDTALDNLVALWIAEDVAAVAGLDLDRAELTAVAA